MTAKKVISRSSAEKNDGNDSQILTISCSKSKKNAVKYTLWRSSQDIEKIEKLKRNLKDVYGQDRYNTDSEIYKKLPELYQNAVKKVYDQQLAIDELTAKLDQLEDLRASFCRIFEICEVKK